MGWMLLLCLRCRPCWRMSSSFPTGGRGRRVWRLRPLGRRVLFVLECDVLWRRG